MSKTGKAIKALLQIVRNPWLLNKVLEEETIWKEMVRERHHLENGFPVIRPEVLFGDFSETVSPFAFLDGGSLVTDLALLKKLARKVENCSYFEIGTWRGESVANVAAVAKSCVTLNLSRQEMESLGLDRRYADLHAYYSRDLPNVSHIEGNTKTFDFASLGKKFDLVFIDGDHHFEMVANDTRKVFEHLAGPQTVVVWHDYARNPESIRYEVMAGILEGAPKSYHDHIFHVANTLCAVYLPQNCGGMPLEVPVIPAGAFSIDLKFIPGK
jgi:predicted O-methyltransferase YrrM